MSLALEWKESRRPDIREGRLQKENRRKEADQARKGLRRLRRNRLLFVCFLLMALLISGLLIFSVYLHVMVVQNEVRTREMERQIDLERRQQEDVRVEIASLESPMRIEKIAADELKMNQVTQAEYLMTPGFIEANTPVADEMSSEEAMVSEATQGVDRQN